MTIDDRYLVEVEQRGLLIQVHALTKPNIASAFPANDKPTKVTTADTPCNVNHINVHTTPRTIGCWISLCGHWRSLLE